MTGQLPSLVSSSVRAHIWKAVAPIVAAVFSMMALGVITMQCVR